jgi:cyclophilin family peptidyl-prolyl cis-trans isomerase/HEAT repeat protein
MAADSMAGIMPQMRKLLIVTALFSACALRHSAAPPAVRAAAPAPAAYGFTIEDEARVLMLEDRREYDPAFVDAWIHQENALHRARIALALARIGPHTFVDTNNNGERDADEHPAGVAQLITLVNDPDPNVRMTAAFALGMLADPSSVDALLQFANDKENGGVAAEAVEALSKLAANVPFAKYAELANASQREGVRARAIRFLFRYKSDEAQAVAASALESPSAIIRQEAAYTLARRAYAPARAMLELMLTDPNVATRCYAASALGRIAAAESVAPLADALRDPHAWVRTNAVIALARIAAKDTKSLDRPAMLQDVRRVIGLTEDPDPGTRVSAVETLGWYAPKSESARKRLLEVAASGSRVEREIAAGAIAKHLNDEKLLPADLTGWAKVRVLESGSAVANSMRARWASDPEPLVRQNAIGSIADADVEAQLPLIRAAIDDPDPVVRSTALDRYQHAKQRDIALLRAAEERARKDAVNDARTGAIDVIADIDVPEREAFLRSLLHDADPMVRAMAADRIETKLKKPRPQYTPLAINRGAADYAEIVLWSRQPHTATIHMTRGNIQLTLLPQDAPMTSWNFAQLARRRYFDNTSFMRVVPNFVIQGGDPRNDMSGGPGYSIRDEINMQKYTRGTVGMALSGPDTGGSQFFITHSPQPHLDGGYTIFARVIDGLNAVVDQTERGDRVETITIDEQRR